MRWGTLCLLFVTGAGAAPRTLAIAAGDCKSPELNAAMLSFSAAVAAHAGTAILPGEAVLERFRPLPLLGVEEIRARLETAQTQFYSGQHEPALAAVRASLTGIERLSPRAEPWALVLRARLLEGLVLKALGRKAEANDAHKRVLRLDPGFRLDADYYTPAAIAAFDALRKEVKAAKKLKLTVTSTPSGAELFLDGAPLGKTPFSGELPAGDYRLTLAAGELTSFTRELKLSRDEAVQVDLAFEGAMRARPPLCVSAPAAGALDTGLKLAALAGAEQVVVLRLESRNNEPGWATAVLIEVSRGARIRDGGVRTGGPKDALSELAGFVLTGKANPRVLPISAEAEGAAARAVAPPADVSEVDRPEEVALATAPAVTPSQVQGSRGSGPRIGSLVVMGAGVAAGIAGLAVYLSGGVDRAALGPLLDPQGRVKDPERAEEAKALGERIDRNNTTGLLVGVGGLAAVGAGAALFFLMPPEAGPTVSVAPLREGALVSARFSF